MKPIGVSPMNDVGGGELAAGGMGEAQAEPRLNIEIFTVIAFSKLRFTPIDKDNISVVIRQNSV